MLGSCPQADELEPRHHGAVTHRKDVRQHCSHAIYQCCGSGSGAGSDTFWAAPSWSCHTGKMLDSFAPMHLNILLISVADPDPDSKLLAGSRVGSGKNHCGSGSGQHGPGMQWNKTSMIKFSISTKCTIKIKRIFKTISLKTKTLSYKKISLYS